MDGDRWSEDKCGRKWRFEDSGGFRLGLMEEVIIGGF